jgi:hypothetical protein
MKKGRLSNVTAKMLRRIGMALGAAGIVGGALTLPAEPAVAVTATRCTNTFDCQLTVFYNGGDGGTLSIDADAIGGEQRLIAWKVRGLNCDGTMWTNDPPRSWICPNTPAGTYTLVASDARQHDWSLGARP